MRIHGTGVRWMRTVLKYYVVIFSTLYGCSIVVNAFDLWRDPNTVLIINCASLIFTLLVAYRLSNDKFVELLGFRREGLWRSLVYTGALLGIVTLALALFNRVSIDEIVRVAMEWAKSGRCPPWMDHTDPMLLPVYALVIWGISGVLSFALLVAYPYEMLGARYLPLVSLMFVLLYNLPLVTGEWKLDDIMVLGLLFPLIYHLTRNSVGLILSYVLLFEFPVMVAFLRGWGIFAFLTILFGRIVWEIFCLIVLIFRPLFSLLRLS